MSLNFGPATRRAIRLCERNTAPGEVPLSTEEWLTFFAAVGISLAAARNRDAAVLAECTSLIEEAGLRTGLPLLHATIKPL